MKKPFLLGGLLVAVPLSVLLQGCSGGSSGLGSGLPTATPSNATATPTASATPTSGTTTVSNLTLGNGQRGILTTIKNGTAVTGTLQIVATPLVSARKVAALPFQFAFGSYKITGTITNSGAFSISGNFGAQGAFTMTGQLQSATQDGSYTIKVNGQTDTGILPKSGQPSTTATPMPTSSTGNYNLTGNLTYSSVSAGEVISTPITSFNNLTDGGSLTTAKIGSSTGQSLGLNGSTGRVTGNGTSRLIQLVLTSYTINDITGGTIKPFSVGQVITFNPTNSILQYSQSTVQGTSISIKAWRSVSGTAVIKAINSDSVTVELKDARIDPSPIFGGTGSFTLNGTITGTGLTVKSQ